jgi:hypothetical protein
MEASELRPGSVFAFPSPNATEPHRALLVNQDVVMYDAWQPHLGSWGMADPARVRRGTWSYYVTLASTALEKARYLRSEPLSPQEEALHRPDLPFAIGQDTAASWRSDRTSAPETAPNASADDVVIAVAQVYLSPFGPRGGHLRAARVQAANGSSLTVDELIRKAAAVQAAHNKDDQPTAGSVYTEADSDTEFRRTTSGGPKAVSTNTFGNSGASGAYRRNDHVGARVDDQCISRAEDADEAAGRLWRECRRIRTLQ